MSLGADYFNLHEYVDKIKLNTKVLEHLEQVNQDFYQYIKKLMEYNKLSVVYFLIDSLYKELDSSSLIEGTFPPKLLLEKDIFFDTLQINHNRIHQLHEFVVSNDPKVPTGKYRDIPVKVAGVEEGKEKFIIGHQNQKLYKTV